MRRRGSYPFTKLGSHGPGAQKWIPSVHGNIYFLKFLPFFLFISFTLFSYPFKHHSNLEKGGGFIILGSIVIA